MENSIEVSTQFDFKGETFRPVVVIDLDEVMQGEGQLPDCYQLLARENGIGPYSYEYEVLESSELHFDKASGLAADFVHDGSFDFDGFRRQWLEQQQLQALALVARQHLGIESLAEQPALRSALLAAYELGRRSTASDTPEPPLP